MFTNNQGITFFKIGNKYWKNSGWLIRESSKEEYEREKAKMDSK